MSDIAIKFENISKQYRLGVVGTGTISHDLNRWWHLVRGKEDPYLQIGQVNDRSAKATSDYVWALKDINFEVKQGDVVGIIGKNGAGKSTLLKILSRVTSPTTGSIKAKGRIASLLEVGTGFHPELTGRENIYMNGAIMGMTKAEITRKLDEIVDFAGVEMYLDTPSKRYSSGMTVRLGFAIAAHLEPEILVVDEVLAVGDAEFQKKAIGKMQDVSRGEGRTVLFVSHNMHSIVNLCQRGVVLEDGTVSYIGTAADAIQFYNRNSIDGDSNIFKILNQGKKIWFSDFQFVNENKDYYVEAGSKCSFNFEIESLDNYDGVTLNICVNDLNGVRIFTLVSSQINHVYNIKKGINKMSCTLDKIFLKPGEYLVDFSIIDQFTILDKYSEPLKIVISASSVYNLASPSPTQGYLMVFDQKWR